MTSETLFEVGAVSHSVRLVTSNSVASTAGWRGVYTLAFSNPQHLECRLVSQAVPTQYYHLEL